jgi:hypothetical protein
MKKFMIGFGAALIFFIMAGSIIFAAPIRGIVNTWRFGIQKADDATAYQTLKKVEDTCRAMIANYNSDKLAYEQYSASADGEKRAWGEQAKMRANKTASSYNNYILQNSFVWRGGIPHDIKRELSYLQ